MSLGYQLMYNLNHVLPHEVLEDKASILQRRESYPYQCKINPEDAKANYVLKIF